MLIDANDSSMPPTEQIDSPIAQTEVKTLEAAPPESPQRSTAPLTKRAHIERSPTSLPASYFDSLPLEIVSLIAIALEGQVETLKSLRGVSKSCTAACTRLLFRKVSLRIDKESMTHLHCKLGNPDIRLAVTDIDIDTAEHTDRNMDTIDWDDQDEELLKLFNHYLTRVGRFHNLRSVSFKFSKSCVGPPLRRHWWASQVPESVFFRMEALQSLFRGLNDPKNLTPRFHSLRIENLQDWADESFIKSDDFEAVMSKVSRLELQIATEADETSPMSFIEKKELHDFFNVQLPQDWLAPCASKLTHLKLYAGRLYWGYIPKCALPHFDNLRSLSLGKMTFSHDTQLDWLLSHSDTLEELVLDDCPILTGMAWFGALDTEGYPVDTAVAISADVPSTHSYAGRWHSYFREFRIRLTSLRVLRCGYNDNDWEQGLAFSRSHTLEPRLWPERYRVFDTCWLERPPFASLNLQGELVAGRYDGAWTGVPFYPSDCTDDDVTELVKLREVLSERVGVVGEDLILLKKMLF